MSDDNTKAADTKTEETKVELTEEEKKQQAKNEEQVAEILKLKESYPDNIAVQVFDQEYYKTLDLKKQTGLLKCIDSGRENPDSGMGCYANNCGDYEDYEPFFKAALEKYHKVKLGTGEGEKTHTNTWDLSTIKDLPESGKLDITALGLPALSMRVRTGRNLKDFPLPGAMTKDDRVAMEAAMQPVFAKLIEDEAYGGKYCSITPDHANFIDKAGYDELVTKHIMFKDMSADKYLLSAGIAQDWPYGRGCYVSKDEGFIIWVGEEDHLRIMCMKKGTVLNEVFDRLKTAVDVVEKLITGGCAMSPTYGVITSCPTNIGTGMRASLHIPLPGLCKDGTEAKAKAVAKPLGLSVRGLGGEHTPIGADGTVDISPSARFCITEAEIMAALYKGIKLLKEEEDKVGVETAVGLAPKEKRPVSAGRRASNADEEKKEEEAAPEGAPAAAAEAPATEEKKE